MGNLSRHHYTLGRWELLHLLVVDLMYPMWFSTHLPGYGPDIHRRVPGRSWSHPPKVVGEELWPN